MTNTETDLIDLDPTDEDILALEADEDSDTPEDDFDLDFDSNYRDDRYADDGIPSWSAWA